MPRLRWRKNASVFEQRRSDNDYIRVWYGTGAGNAILSILDYDSEPMVPTVRTENYRTG